MLLSATNDGGSAYTLTFNTPFLQPPGSPENSILLYSPGANTWDPIDWQVLQISATAPANDGNFNADCTLAVLLAPLTSTIPPNGVTPASPILQAGVPISPVAAHTTLLEMTPIGGGIYTLTFSETITPTALSAEPSILIFSPSQNQWLPITWTSLVAGTSQVVGLAGNPTDGSACVALGLLQTATATDPLSIASPLITIT
jgi:hypothetical protein